ncbi:MAG: holo-ACP synthase [Acidobacteriota bacterium]
MLGVGVDIVEIERVQSVPGRRRAAFLSRVFFEGERRYCESRRDPAGHVAARFAAKEAVTKALVVRRGMTTLWRDIEIRRDERRSPAVRLTGWAQQLAAEQGVSRFVISLSHSDTHAVALAMAA